MLQGTDSNSTVEVAVSNYLAKLSPAEKESSQPGLNRFIRWFGHERPMSGLTAPEVANFAERLSLTDADYVQKLDKIRAFLVKAKKEGWVKISLATHLKAKKGKGSSGSAVNKQRESISLTAQGHADMKAELEELKRKRVDVTDEIRKAAADKDFKENAPYHAARERKGHIEGRIIEIEDTLKVAVVIDKDQKASRKISMGDSVILYDVVGGKELSCIIVHPKETDLSKGKISSLSPIGKAVLGHLEGDVVEITAPAGKLLYQVKQIKR
jgi:transcription elongation factor GreA